VELIRNTTPPTHTLTEPLAVEVPAAAARGDASVRALPGRGDHEQRSAALTAPVEVSGREQRQQRRLEAQRLAAQDVPPREIARRFGVHPTTVARWLNAPDDSTEGSSDEHDD